MADYGWAYINLDVLKKIESDTHLSGGVGLTMDEFTVSSSHWIAAATSSNNTYAKLSLGRHYTELASTVAQLDVSASAGDTICARFDGDVQITGSLSADKIVTDIILSSSNLVISDSVIGLGFGSGSTETGSVGDRGLILGLQGNLNQAVIWDQSSGSFVIGKVGAQGPTQTGFNVGDADLSTIKLGRLTASVGVSGTLGQFSNLTAADVEVNAEHALLTLRSNAANGDQQIKFRSGDGSQMGLIRSDVTSNTLNHISLGANNSEIQLVLDTNARVGVGTQTPAGTLHVSSSTTGDKTLVVSAVGGQSADIVTVQNKTGATAFKVDQDGNVSTSANTTLGDAAGDTLTINAQTVNIPNVAAGTDNTVVIYNGSTLLTDEIDSRVWGSTLLDGSNGTDNELAIFTDGNSVEGDSNLTFDGSTLTVGNDISVAAKVLHTGDSDTHMKFDTDKIEFTAGNETLLTLKEDTQDVVIVGDGGDVDLQVKTGNETHTLFVQGDNDRVGIRCDDPKAILHMSQSGNYPLRMPQPLLRLDHVGDGGSKQNEKPILFVTGGLPESDWMEGRVGINTDQPGGAFQVNTKLDGNAGTVTLYADSQKVGVCTNGPNSLLTVYNKGTDSKIFRVTNIDTTGAHDNEYSLFYVSGSTDNDGTGFFGSSATGSALVVSGSSFLTDVELDGHLKMTAGIMVEYLTVTDEDAQNVSLSAAEFKKGIVVHTSTSGEGTVTMDTAANLISTLNLTADNMTAHCYYINDGNQNVLVSGAATGVTYADTGCKIKENCAATILVRRTGGAAVTVYVIGGS